MTNSKNHELIKFSELNFNELVSDFLFNKIAELVMLSNEDVNIGLSGGTTPLPILFLLKEKKIDWKRINFFIVDERCVPIDSKESNFGNLSNYFLDFIPSKKESMILTGYSYLESVHKYEKVVFEMVPSGENGLPKFDLILLGMGDDGHIASLFPNTEALYENEKIVVINEVSKLNSKRITVTYPLLLNAKELIIIVKGKEKEKIINELYSDNSTEYPVLRIVKSHKNLKWLIG